MIHYTEHASVEEIREFCNRVREAGGAELIDALLPSEPEVSDACLIANALNFACQVEGTQIGDLDPELYGHRGTEEHEVSVWGMMTDKDTSRRIADALGLPVRETDHFIEVVLPAKIGAAAYAFDEAWRAALYEAEVPSSPLLAFVSDRTLNSAVAQGRLDSERADQIRALRGGPND